MGKCLGKRFCECCNELTIVVIIEMYWGKNVPLCWECRKIFIKRMEEFILECSLDPKKIDLVPGYKIDLEKLKGSI